jgi:hypothetical protein
VLEPRVSSALVVLLGGDCVEGFGYIQLCAHNASSSFSEAEDLIERMDIIEAASFEHKHLQAR